MILAPPEKIKVAFQFMSLPFELRAEILHFYMYSLLENYFISSTQASLHCYSYVPTATF